MNENVQRRHWKSQEIKPLPSKLSISFPGISALWINFTIGAALLALAAMLLKGQNGRKRSVDKLASRGLIFKDRNEDLKIMSQFEDPTVVKAYRVGNFELKEVDKLPRLTEEKKKLHREARMAEHGWKQKEVVLVEGDEIPEGVDEKAVRFIPRSHPFAKSDEDKNEAWSEDVVRRRLGQRRGMPEKKKFEAQKRLQSLRKAADKDSAKGGQKGGWGEEFLPPTAKTEDMNG